MNIGFQSKQTGTLIIEDEEIEGKTPEEADEIISTAVWEDAIQFVDTGWEIVE
jgi:hypothetical protein